MPSFAVIAVADALFCSHSMSSFAVIAVADAEIAVIVWQIGCYGAIAVAEVMNNQKM